MFNNWPSKEEKIDMICNIYPFHSVNTSNHGQLQANNVIPLNSELGRDVQSALANQDKLAP